MSLNRFHLVHSQTGSELMAFALGQPYPVSLQKGTVGASLNSFGDGSTLFLNVVIPRPRPEEYLGFREGFRFRIYQGKDMPGGLIMIRMLLDSMEVGDIFELPFDAVRQVNSDPDSLGRFFTSRKVALLATLTDSGEKQSRVIAIRMLELPPSVVERLRELWQDQLDCDMNYEANYRKLASRKSIEQIWRAAEVF